jgi:hypothetical protein
MNYMDSGDIMESFLRKFFLSLSREFRVCYLKIWVSVLFFDGYLWCGLGQDMEILWDSRPYLYNDDDNFFWPYEEQLKYFMQKVSGSFLYRPNRWIPWS